MMDLKNKILSIYIKPYNMKPLFSNSDLLLAKQRDKLPCECITCNITFYLSKNNIKRAMNPNNSAKGNYCSRKCNKSKFTKQNVYCNNCNKTFQKLPSEIKRTKNNFCSKSCAATYNNKHKTTGIRRSKLEVWLEEKLTNLYPNLEIHFNRKDTINSELDIYIPSLKLAFELNGIFHYEPIFGNNKLNQIQENDNNKFQLCQKQNISFCTIDTSQQKYVKESTSKKYLDIIIKIINHKTTDILL